MSIELNNKYSRNYEVEKYGKNDAKVLTYLASEKNTNNFGKIIKIIKIYKY